MQKRPPFTPVSGPTWPDGTRRSQGNFFDQHARLTSIDWGAKTKSAAEHRVREAKAMVAGEAFEAPIEPVVPGALSRGYVQIGRRKGDAGRKRMKEAHA